MKTFKLSVLVFGFLLVTSAAAQDKVVVIPLGSKKLPVAEGTVESAGQVWMNRNLGASRVATSLTDTYAYGDLYQWGRLADGHESRRSLNISTLSTSDVPGHGSFIMGPEDWLTSQNDNLWQGISGINNPCPAGFRLPTEAEWEIERASWSSNNSAGAFASPLKLLLAGYRYNQDGTLSDETTAGSFWSSSVDGIKSRVLVFSNGNAYMSSELRSEGHSVRCLKD